MACVSVNPATGEVIERIDSHSAEMVAGAVERAAAKQREWRTESFERRSSLMYAVAAGLEARRDEFAKIISQEMGKPIRQSRAEVEKCASVCRYYASEAEAMLQKEAITSDATLSYARFDPLGVILAVMPWNFPFWQVFRFAAPALMAGNTCLLKHASNVPRSAMCIEDVFTEAGFMPGCFTTLLIDASAVAAVVEHPLVAAVTLTGSETAGGNVAARAGACLKKSVLELGGSDPFIVLADADVPTAARIAASARMINTGQSCIAAKRFIIEAPVYDSFIQEFVTAVSALRVGDPLEESTDIGPMAREDLLRELDEQVQRSIQQGARVLLGGHRLDRPGAYYAPTVIEVQSQYAAVMSEETFGPVAAVMKAGSETEAMELANATEFGLGASLWTSNPIKAERLAAQLEAGCVFVNGMVKSDPRLPFGGIKRSGYGRELSHVGIREFVNIKTVWMGFSVKED